MRPTCPPSSRRSRRSRTSTPWSGKGVGDEGDRAHRGGSGRDRPLLAGDPGRGVPVLLGADSAGPEDGKDGRGGDRGPDGAGAGKPVGGPRGGGGPPARGGRDAGLRRG